MSPSGWHMLPLKRVFTMQTGVWGEEPDRSAGVQCVRVADFDRARQTVGDVPTYRAVTGTEFAKTRLRAGDLLLEKSGGTDTNPVGFVVRYTGRGPAVCSNFIARLRLVGGHSSRFWNFALAAAYFDGRTWPYVKKTTGIQNLDIDAWRAMRVPTPPADEQRAIADFLDRETAKIDALIEKQNELIGLLQERRQRAIKNLVLGRDFSQCRPSSQWFGSVPEHWATPRISHHHDVVLGRMINASMNGVDDIEIPYLAAGSIQPEELVADDSKTITIPRGEVTKYTLKRDDIVVVEGGAGYGRSHVLRRDLPGWAFQNHVARVRGRTQLWDARYLRWVVETCRLSGFFVANNRTATLPSLSRDVLGALRVPRPPLVEQRDIADRLDQETARIDALIAKAEEFISLARERRAALITATVTGQIDVAGEAS